MLHACFSVVSPLLAAIFFQGHPYIGSTTVLPDYYDLQAIVYASNVSRKTWRRCSAHYVYAIAKKKKAQKSMLRHSYRYQRVFSC